MARLELNHFTQLPHWLKSISSDYLHHGHRAPTKSYYMCIKSLFIMHTETINIWTHLIPCFLFVFFFIDIVTSNLTAVDKWVLSSFLIGALVCHGFSTAFHLFLCHSEQVCKIFQKLDYCGIAVLITASFVPWLHYGFYYGEYIYAQTYLAGVVTMAAIAIYLVMDDKYGRTEYRPIRALGFALFGLFGIVPSLHWFIINQDEFWTNVSIKTSFLSLVAMGVLYIVGASLYASRVPERLFPGKCDLYLHSHQIFHVLVTLAALVHYYGLNILLEHVKTMHPEHAPADALN